jgi:hypothetical protein
VQGVDTSANLPLGWARPPQRLSAEPGPHRFVWDLRYTPPPATQHGYPISAIWGDTPLEPRGVWVMPGEYRVQLTVQGRTYEAPLVVRMDPRVKTNEEDLGMQFSAAMRIVELWRRDSAAIGDVRAMRAVLDSMRKAATGPRADSLASFDGELAALLSGGGRRRAAAADTGARGPREPQGSLMQVDGELGGLYSIIEGNDSAPTSQAVMAFFTYEHTLTALLGRWDALRREASGLGVVGR